MKKLNLNQMGAINGGACVISVGGVAITNLGGLTGVTALLNSPVLNGLLSSLIGGSAIGIGSLITPAAGFGGATIVCS